MRASPAANHARVHRYPDDTLAFPRHSKNIINYFHRSRINHTRDKFPPVSFGWSLLAIYIFKNIDGEIKIRFEIVVVIVFNNRAFNCERPNNALSHRYDDDCVRVNRYPGERSINILC